MPEDLAGLDSESPHPENNPYPPTLLQGLSPKPMRVIPSPRSRLGNPSKEKKEIHQLITAPQLSQEALSPQVGAATGECGSKVPSEPSLKELSLQP